MIGTKLGPYEILEKIGAGGMGEVYRARDTRLGRDVAVKVLPEGLTADANRLKRFEQEARSAGMLNHPNILAIYDIGTTKAPPSSSRSYWRGRRCARAWEAARCRSARRWSWRSRSPRGWRPPMTRESPTAT